MLGILLIDKPQGITSHDVVNAVRRRLHTRRVGHAGSLDPLATGSLVVAVGPATRFLQYLPLEPKEYVAEVRFGVETNTQDAEGEVVAERPVPGDLVLLVKAAIPAFIGPVEQIPPMFSAVKKAGKPLYAYARKGEEVDRAARTVYIEAFEFLEVIDESTIRFRIVCSGGTYVRTLAHDLGASVGCGAHLTALRRTRVGRFRLEDAITLDEAEASKVIALADAVLPMPIIVLDDARTREIREGRSVPGAVEGSHRLVALADSMGRVFSVARVTGNRLQPECVIPAEAIGSGAL